MRSPNFIIGRGELLTHDIKSPPGGGGKSEVYSFSEAFERLESQFDEVSQALEDLPKATCPGDYAVAQLLMNPSYIAKSYFPSSFLRHAGLVSIGSKSQRIIPNKWSKKNKPEECSTTNLLVAGKRSAFKRITKALKEVEKDSSEAIDFARIESFQNFTVEDRLKSGCADYVRWYEIGLNLFPGDSSIFILEAFSDFSRQLGIEFYAEHSFEAGNLRFVPVEGNYEAIKSLAEFQFIRTVRPIPRLRRYQPIQRGMGPEIKCQLPTEQPLSSKPKVAILDGGLPDDHAIGSWLGSYKKLDPDVADDPNALGHGLAVTAAFLFGPLSPTETSSRPFSYVDHLRVLDRDTGKDDPLELYRTLGLIEEAMLSRQYEFINLSLGPDLPIEDTDVHAWTSVIDDLLSDGETFMTIAAGNNGEMDQASGNARVQVPADCVNGVSVGATSCTTSTWQRSPYSAFGPGRMPGVVKPDLVAFGGGLSNYFHVLNPGSFPTLTPIMGTSFAAPYLLRSAVGIRAVLGEELPPLAIKALLVHTAHDKGFDKREVGWGKIQEDVFNIITCQSDEARIVYKGELKPGKYLRANVPLPKAGLKGMVNLKATFCYSCPTDPQDTCSYTRAGLDITFRPDVNDYKKGSTTPKSKSFFSMKKYASEEERRSDIGKWETVMHDEARMRGTTLQEPVFDIHYNAREAGSATGRAEKIKYALVISIHAPKVKDLYNDILRDYVSILTAIQPEVSIPIQV